MTEPQSTSSASPPVGVHRRWTYAVLGVAFLFVLMPFLFWQSTWFGRPLTDEDIARNLADAEHPRKAQHALSQIADRIVARNPEAKKWYPQVVALAGHKMDEIRLTAAWVMGQDNAAPEFHEALRRLLADPNPMVRRNAALSLVRFGDAAGRPEILAMLRSYAVPSPEAGVLLQRLKPGDTVNPGTLLGRIRIGETDQELRSPVPGTVERWPAADGSSIQRGEAAVLVAPSPEMVWEALRALVLIGLPEDLPEVDRFARPVEGMPEMIARQAELAARAIRSRSGN